MMTNALLTEAIRKDWDAIKAFLPARTATYLRYDKGAKNAVAWNEGGKETKIPLPLQDGWYVPENPFAIPNGKPSNRDDPDALYLVRHQLGNLTALLGVATSGSTTSGGGTSVPTSGPMFRGGVDYAVRQRAA